MTALALALLAAVAPPHPVQRPATVHRVATTAGACHIAAGGPELVISGTPGGAAFSRIGDGAAVLKGQLARDAENRSWLFIRDGGTGQRLGWVPAATVRCP